jgi:hypothetical protein
MILDAIPLVAYVVVAIVSAKLLLSLMVKALVRTNGSGFYKLTHEEAINHFGSYWVIVIIGAIMWPALLVTMAFYYFILKWVAGWVKAPGWRGKRAYQKKVAKEREATVRLREKSKKDWIDFNIEMKQ